MERATHSLGLAPDTKNLLYIGRSEFVMVNPELPDWRTLRVPPKAFGSTWV